MFSFNRTCTYKAFIYYSHLFAIVLLIMKNKRLFNFLIIILSVQGIKERERERNNENLAKFYLTHLLSLAVNFTFE